MPAVVTAFVALVSSFSFAPTRYRLECGRSARLLHPPRLQTLTAPPAPPPTVNRGGGGDDGEGGEFLRLVESTEADGVLQDWTSRSRIYQMTDNAELKERHSSALDTILEMLGRCQESCAVPDDDSKENAPLSARRLTLGLYGPADLPPHALADAEISQSGVLVVKLLAINPAECNEVASTAALRILCGLRSLAEAIGVQLDIEALRQVNKGRFWLAGMVLLPATPLEDGR